MAKICKTCGTENADNAIYCRECGSPFNQQAEEPVVQQAAPAVDAPLFEAPVEAPAEEAPATKEENKLLAKVDALLAKVNLNRKTALIILGAVVGAIVFLSIVLSLLFPGPKAVVNKLMRGIANEDAKAIINCMPSYIWEDDADEKEELIERYEDTFDYLEIDKFEYEIKKVSKLDDDEIDDMEDVLDSLEEYYDDFDADKVTGFREVKVKMTAKVDGERETNTVKIILIKYKGQWKVYNFGSVIGGIS